MINDECLNPTPVVVPPEEYAAHTSLWIDREGTPYAVYGDKCYENGYSGHYDFAKTFYPELDGTYGLEDMGWIHLSACALICYKGALTKKQKQFIESWAIEFRMSEKIDEAICDLTHDKFLGKKRKHRVNQHLNLGLPIHEDDYD